VAHLLGVGVCRGPRFLERENIQTNHAREPCFAVVLNMLMRTLFSCHDLITQVTLFCFYGLVLSVTRFAECLLPDVLSANLVFCCQHNLVLECSIERFVNRVFFW
jgi:hypothetical protein